MIAGCRSSQPAKPAGAPPRGVLELRILADRSQDEGAGKIAACRTAFTKEGPTTRGAEEGYGWFKIKDPADFFKTKDLKGQFDRIQKETPLVTERRGDEYYVLAHTVEDYTMTHAAGAPEWSAQTARLNRSTQGYLAVEVELDGRGAAQLEKLTGDHRGKVLGVFLDDQTIMKLTITDVIRQSIRITGAFSLREAEDLEKLLQQSKGLPK
ncbi:MAG TPA: hypothetical protein VMV94_11490 [Phycisphaerae bacterium]|nr:hypothetical protein [Phycisphaerae bacterium]